MNTKTLSAFPIVLFVLVGAVLGFYSMQSHRTMTSASSLVFVNSQPIVVTNIKAEKIAIAQPKAIAQAKVAMNPGPVIMPIMPPAISFKVLPLYPQAALSAGQQGMVLLSALVGLGGQVEQVQVKTSSGVADLDQSAINAVSQWKFNPASQAGAALSSWFEVPVRFSIQ